jgi:DNA-binding response OmpR family regulator
MLQRTCLLVDDDKFVTELIAPLLNVRGYKAISVHSGRDALRAIERSVPSFVILDVNLPDMTGFDVLRAIRRAARTSEVLVFMLTGRNEAAAQLMSFDLGATEFFQKPVDPKEMMEQIQDILWARKSLCTDALEPVI